MSKIFLIGNGFDIASGLPTRYCQFRQWFMKNYDLDYSRLNRIIDENALMELDIPEWIIGPKGDIIYDECLADFFYALITYANPNDVTWNEFEKNLSKLPFYEFEDSYLYDGDDEFEEADIVEQVGTNLSKVFVDAVNKYFTKWIRYIFMVEMKNKNIKLKKLICENKESKFLTFNYTDVLEQFYGISDEMICHIHGYIKNSEPLVIGHGDEIINDDDFDPLNINSYMVEAEENLKKPVMKIIAKNSNFFKELGVLNEIYIIGWGLSNPDFVDAPYLQEVIKHTDFNTVIYFDIFDKERVADYKLTCRKNGFNGKFGISDSDSSEKYLV